MILQTKDDLAFRVAMPPAARLCGVDLMPLTIGHADLLNALSLWGAFTEEQLILAAFVCSRPASAYRRAMHSRWTQVWFAWRRLRLGSSWGIDRSRIVWREYVHDHTDSPVAVGRGKSQPMIQTQAEAVRTRLLMKCGYRPETIEDTPYLRAQLDYYFSLEAEDQVALNPNTVMSVREAVAQAVQQQTN